MVSDEFLEFVIGQLEPAVAVQVRRMFGGAGLYCADTIFAIVAGDVLYFKVDHLNRVDYERDGMKPFRPYSGRATAMPYFEVPAYVLEDAELLREWASRAVAAGLRSRSQSSD